VARQENEVRGVERGLAGGENEVGREGRGHANDAGELANDATELPRRSLSIRPRGLYTGSVPSPSSLATLEVVVVDCQATFAGPRGQLLELGWARVGAEPVAARARLIRLPEGEHVPPAVARITGITDRLLRDGIPAAEAWRELWSEASALPLQPAPTVAHFAQFERPFLARLAGGASPLDVACAHQIAVRLFPDLPRRSLRALAGYFGRSVGRLRRSAEHVEATAFVWTHLVALLEERGVRTWPELRAWLAAPALPAASPRRTKRGWPMPREVRLAVPDRPGLYRMLRTSGDVLYVGKATSLHHRVNSYFRKQRGIHERTLEMLSQARALSFEVTESPLEAALLEPDEIKRHRPPYNEALTEGDRSVWFAPRDLTARSPRSGPSFGVGPFPSAELLDKLGAIAVGAPEALGPTRWAPPVPVFDAGVRLLRGAHRELAEGIDPRRLLRFGGRLWREGRRLRDEEDDEDEGVEPAHTWTPELVAAGLEWLALRGALAARRARWLTALVESTLVWTEPPVPGARLLVVEDGEIAVRSHVEPGAEPPVPGGHARTRQERHAGFTVARLDRLRVLTTELKRLVSKGHPVTLRLAPDTTFSGPRLARILAWL
jgi:DNA polymerase-3 subunit epsilon